MTETTEDVVPSDGEMPDPDIALNADDTSDNDTAAADTDDTLKDPPVEATPPVYIQPPVYIPPVAPPAVPDTQDDEDTRDDDTDVTLDDDKPVPESPPPLSPPTVKNPPSGVSTDIDAITFIMTAGSSG